MWKPRPRGQMTWSAERPSQRWKLGSRAHAWCAASVTVSGQYCWRPTAGCGSPAVGLLCPSKAQERSHYQELEETTSESKWKWAVFKGSAYQNGLRLVTRLSERASSKYFKNRYYRDSSRGNVWMSSEWYGSLACRATLTGPQLASCREALGLLLLYIHCSSDFLEEQGERVRGGKGLSWTTAWIDIVFCIAWEQLVLFISECVGLSV